VVEVEVALMVVVEAAQMEVVELVVLVVQFRFAEEELVVVAVQKMIIL
jgi:hypothetical protein